MAAGDFDYGGAAFMGPLLTDYNVSAPRELMQVDGKYWFTNFAQPLRGSCEPPPGATGLASSENGLDWERASSVPLPLFSMFNVFNVQRLPDLNLHSLKPAATAGCRRSANDCSPV